MQIKGKVIKGWVGVPSTLTIEVKEGLVGPRTPERQKKWCQSVSMRKEAYLQQGQLPWAPMKLWLSGLGVLGSVSHQP
jgi:hypothetical protein